MTKKNELILGAEGFILGGIAGGLTALLLAPKSGAETRHDIYKYSRLARMKKRKLISDAKLYSHEMVRRAQEILDKSVSFASGKYNGSIDGFEKELAGIRAGFNKAIEAYKNYPGQSTDNMVEEIFVDFDDPSLKNLNDEELPKREGMGRRSN